MSRKASKDVKKDILAWWRRARFGMFIHWGLYALPAGVWKGQQYPGLAEWLMWRAKISLAEYRKLASRFNPVKFDAEQWVTLAKDCGMKYIVITAKHHDGFAMYGSKVSPYNIVDATPFGRDIMKELSRACRKAGIRLGFYYSQTQDWEHPDAEGNNWDFDESKKNFPRYLREKSMPQIHELLTNYGPVALIWFDTPGAMKLSQSLAIKRMVHSLQLACLISGRIGNEVFDYDSLGDNQIPRRPFYRDIETPATINDTWGYKKADKNWKTGPDLLYLLTDLTGKGVNYLLNVGPMASGAIPAASIRSLRFVGKWMKINSQAIYGTSPSPFPYVFDWGRMTWKGNKLFLLFYRWPGKRAFTLHGLKNKVAKAYLLADKGKKVQSVQAYDKAMDDYILKLTLPAKAPDKNVSVVVLELDGAPKVDVTPMQQDGGRLSLFAHMAQLHKGAKDSRLSITRGGVTTNWHSTKDWMSWDFKLYQPGRFRLDVIIARGGSKMVSSGVKAVVSIDGKKVKGVTSNKRLGTNPGVRYFPEATTNFGHITLARPGTYHAEVRTTQIKKSIKNGFTFASVELTPVK